MDGLRRFPSFIKRGGRTRPDAELILQKKLGGRATTSLVSPSYKSPAAAALRGAGVIRCITPLQPQHAKGTGRSCSHYEWVMWRCQNLPPTSAGQRKHSEQNNSQQGASGSSFDFSNVTFRNRDVSWKNCTFSVRFVDSIISHLKTEH